MRKKRMLLLGITVSVIGAVLFRRGRGKTYAAM